MRNVSSIETIKDKLENSGRYVAVGAASAIAVAASVASVSTISDSILDQPQQVQDTDSISNPDNSAETIKSEIDANKNKLDALSANNTENPDYSLLGC